MEVRRDDETATLSWSLHVSLKSSSVFFAIVDASSSPIHDP
jgi:hypothetical protein